VASSSCMTCHSRALHSIEAASRLLTSAFVGKEKRTSRPDAKASWYWTSFKSASAFPGPRQTSTPHRNKSADFVWSIPFCANRRTSTNPPTPQRSCVRATWTAAPLRSHFPCRPRGLSAGPTSSPPTKRSSALLLFAEPQPNVLRCHRGGTS